MARIFDDITATIGGTPLVRLQRMDDTDATVLVKLESFNPGASVKDRIGRAIIDAAEADGSLPPGGTIVEGTSGNTGIALAMVGAARGYRVILTPAAERGSGMVRKAEELAQKNGWFLARQFENEANVRVHRETTAEEIWADTDGDVDIFISGIGTGGTITGAGNRLKELNPDIRIIAVEPADSPLLTKGTAGPHKIQGLGANFVPALLDTGVYDEVIDVELDDAVRLGRRLAADEGIFAGISSGAIVWAALEVAKRPESAGKTIVAIVCDTGERYLSMPIYADLA